jgi:nucleoside-diphosphate-sugar epimerase
MPNEILITGASGFVGFHLAKKLSENKSNHLYLVDNQIRSDFDVDFKELCEKNNVTYIHGDLKNADFIAKLPEVSSVFHLAAFNGTQNFYSRPWDVFDNSLRPTILLLERYSTNLETNFLYTGTSESYADAVSHGISKIPTNEDSPIYFHDLKNPRWSYGFAKTSGEVALHAASQQFGSRYQIFRLHNIYGTRMGFEHVIPDLIRKQLAGNGDILGARQSRSFLHISDAINIMISLSNVESAYNQTINIGSPIEITISQLAKKISNLTKYKGDFVDLGAPLGSVDRRVPDLSKLMSLLSLENFRSLDDGLSETFEYMTSRKIV